ADHQQAKADDVGQAVRDLIRRARVHQAAGETIGDAKALLHFAQRHNAAVRRRKPPSNLTSTRLPETGDNPGNGNIGWGMAGVASLKSRESASTTRFYTKSDI